MIIAVLVFLVSCIPAVLIYLHLKGLHGDDPDYRTDCRKVLLGGVLCSVGVFLFDALAFLAWSRIGLDRVSPLLNDAFRCFILAGVIEEYMKYRTARKTIRARAESISWIDMVAFAAIAAIGFELIEGVVYFFESNIGQMLVRGITVMHVAFGLLMGYYLGKAEYTKDKSNKVKALLFPMLIHGIYDFSLVEELTEKSDFFIFLPFIMIAITFAILFRMLMLIKKSGNDPMYSQPFSRAASAADAAPSRPPPQ